jgi:hypothetical protein
LDLRPEWGDAAVRLSSGLVPSQTSARKFPRRLSLPRIVQEAGRSALNWVVMQETQNNGADVVLKPAMTRSELFDLLRFYRGEDQHESNLLSGRMNWYLTSQSFLVLAVCITETGPYPWLQIAIPTLVSILGMTLTVYIKPTIDAGCETVSRWKYPQALVWNRLSPYLIRKRHQLRPAPTPSLKGMETAPGPEATDVVEDASMIFLYRTPALFYMTWSLLGGACLCNNPLLASHVALKTAIATVWFAVTGILGYSRLRQTTPLATFTWPATGQLADWRRRHTISLIVPSLGDSACQELIQASGADLPRQYIDLMHDCDGLVIDNCHIFGLSDVRDSLRIDDTSYYQLAEIADVGGLYAAVGTGDSETIYLISYDNAAGYYQVSAERGGFYAVIELHLCPSLMVRTSEAPRTTTP